MMKSILFFTLLFWLSTPLIAQLNQNQKVIEGAELEDKAGELIKEDVKLLSENGEVLQSKDIFQSKTPVVFNFAYYNCPMLCSLALNGLANTLKETKLIPGKDFKVVTISFDPKDTSSDAKSYGERYRKAAGIDDEDAWQFFVSQDESVKELANSVGFNYIWSEEKQEFLHGAALFFSSIEGRLTRMLHGIHYRALDFKLSVTEAKQKRSRSNLERALLYCFTYNPGENSYIIHAINLMRIGGGVSVLVLFGFIFVFFQKERLSTGDS